MVWFCSICNVGYWLFCWCRFRWTQWLHEEKLDSSCKKSKTGCVICVANCPIIWSSELQTDIAMSTMEASTMLWAWQSQRLLLWKGWFGKCQLVQTVWSSIGLRKETIRTFKTAVWEDNFGALTLAKKEPGRTNPQSKFYAVKYHWFCSKLKPNFIEFFKW